MFNPIYSYIDHYRTIADMLTLNKIGLADRGHEDVSPTGNLLKVSAARMHHRYRGIRISPLPHQQKRQRLSNDHAAPKNNHLGARDRDVAFEQKSLNP